MRTSGGRLSIFLGYGFTVGVITAWDIVLGRNQGSIWLGLGLGFLTVVAGTMGLVMMGRPSGSIRPAPGSFLRNVAMTVFTKKSFERIYQPLIADMRVEHSDALLDGRPGWARFVHYRWALIFFLTMIAHGFAATAKALKKLYVAS